MKFRADKVKNRQENTQNIHTNINILMEPGEIISTKPQSYRVFSKKEKERKKDYKRKKQNKSFVRKLCAEIH